jgi:hypothetical protein
VVAENPKRCSRETENLPIAPTRDGCLDGYICQLSLGAHDQTPKCTLPAAWLPGLIHPIHAMENDTQRTVSARHSGNDHISHELASVRIGRPLRFEFVIYYLLTIIILVTEVNEHRQ